MTISSLLLLHPEEKGELLHYRCGGNLLDSMQSAVLSFEETNTGSGERNTLWFAQVQFILQYLYHGTAFN